MKVISTYFVFILTFFIVGCTEEEIRESTPEDIENVYEDIGDLLEEQPGDKKVSRGSCNFIPAKSTCIDYVGSFWTEQQIKLQCQEGVYSKNTCPYSEFGGCQTGGGTMTEIVVWHYATGGGGFDAENIVYARGSCNALPVAQWINN